jgi:head-tail adaptor
LAYNWKKGRLQAGNLRHRIDIVKVSPIQDSAGGINFSNVVVYSNVWASVEALSGMETFAANTQVSASSHQIIIRYIAAAPSWQANYLYPAGTLVRDNAGYLQQAQTPGFTSSAIAPTWNETEGMYTEDGDPSLGGTWLNLGIAPPATGITSAMQCLFQGRLFQVKNVLNPDEKNKMLCLLVTEIADSKLESPNVPSTDLG